MHVELRPSYEDRVLFDACTRLLRSTVRRQHGIGFAIVSDHARHLEVVRAQEA